MLPDSKGPHDNPSNSSSKTRGWGFTFWGNCIAFLCRVILQLDQFPTQLQAQLCQHKATHKHRGATRGTPREQKVWEPPKQSNSWGIAALSKKKEGRIRLELRKWYWGNEIVFTRRSQRSHFGKSWRQILTSHNQDNESWAQNPPWTYMLSWNQSICNLGVSEYKSVPHWIQNL